MLRNKSNEFHSPALTTDLLCDFTFNMEASIFKIAPLLLLFQTQHALLEIRFKIKYSLAGRLDYPLSHVIAWHVGDD